MSKLLALLTNACRRGGPLGALEVSGAGGCATLVMNNQTGFHGADFSSLRGVLGGFEVPVWLVVVLALVPGMASASCATASAPMGTATPKTAAVATRVPAPTATHTPTPTRIGALFDLSGVTADLARPYVDAVRIRLKMANREGGVKGRLVELVEVDYGYDAVLAVDGYKRLATEGDIVSIIGWSADADALSPMLAQDKMPYFSASLAASLVDHPPGRAYNFLLGATYRQQVGALFQHVKGMWQMPDREPKLALVFADDNLGRSPMIAARADAGRQGLKVVDEQSLPPFALDAKPQLSSVKSKAPDFVLVSALGPLAAIVVRDAAQVGLQAQLMLLNWATDEDLPKLAGPAAEKVIGATPFAFIDDRPDFAAQVKAAFVVDGREVPALGTRHLQGWLNAGMLLEGINRARGKLSGEAVKRGLETIRDHETGGTTEPITWTAQQHVGSTRVRLYQVREGAWWFLAQY